MSSLSQPDSTGSPGAENPGPAPGGAPRHPRTQRYPGQHRASWLTGWIVLAVWIVVSVVFLPGLVNSAAYLTGLSPTARFVPVSYGQACSKGVCNTVTLGHLEPSGMAATWDSRVPLGRPFTVRMPVWAWGTGHHLIDSTRTAVGVLAFSLVFDAATALGLFAAARVTMRVSRQRRDGLAQAAAATRQP